MSVKMAEIGGERGVDLVIRPLRRVRKKALLRSEEITAVGSMESAASSEGSGLTVEVEETSLKSPENGDEPDCVRDKI